MTAHLHIQLTPLKDALPGMRLADDLLDQQGQVLLAKGTELSESSLQALQRHGVAAVPVEAALSPAEGAARMEQERERIEFAFRRIDTEMLGAPRTLYELVRHYRLGEPA